MKQRFSQIPNAFLRQATLSDSAFRIGALLFTYSAGRCYPPISKLMKLSGKSRGTVIKALSELENLQIIHIQRSNGPGRCNHYTIRPEAEWKMVQNLDHLKVQNLTTIGLKNRPLSVQNLDSNNTKNNTNSNSSIFTLVSNTDTTFVNPIHNAHKGAALQQLQDALAQALSGSKYFHEVPSRVKELVSQFGPETITMEEIKKMIEPNFSKGKGPAIYAKLIVLVEAAYRAGQDAYAPTESAEEQLQRLKPFIKPESKEEYEARRKRDIEQTAQIPFLAKALGGVEAVKQLMEAS